MTLFLHTNLNVVSAADIACLSIWQYIVCDATNASCRVYKKPVKLILMNVTYQWQHTENKCTNVKRDLTIIFYTGGPNQNP